LLIDNGGYIFAEDTISLVASHLKGKNIVIDSKEIRLTAGIEYASLTVCESGLSFGVGKKGNSEAALFLGAYYSSIRMNQYTEQAHFATLEIENSRINVDSFIRNGGFIKAKNSTIVAKEIIDQAPVLRFYHDFSVTSASCGLKIGAKTSLANAVTQVNSLIDTSMQENPALIKAVNFVANAYGTYMQISNILEGKAIKGGIWLYFDFNIHYHSEYSTTQSKNPINAEQFLISSEKWHMDGVVASGNNWYVNVKEIEAKDSKDEVKKTWRKHAIELVMGVFTSGFEFGGNYNQHQNTKESKNYYGNVIDVDGYILINSKKVSGVLQVNAIEIQAFIEVLELLTKQDEEISKISAFSASVNAGVGVSTGVEYCRRSSSQITREGHSGFNAKNLLLVNSSNLIYLEGAYLTNESDNVELHYNSIKLVPIKDEVKSEFAGLGISSERISPKLSKIDKNRIVKPAIGHGIVVHGDEIIRNVIAELGDIARDKELEELVG
jgi:hypothetical protein